MKGKILISSLLVLVISISSNHFSRRSATTEKVVDGLVGDGWNTSATVESSSPRARLFDFKHDDYLERRPDQNLGGGTVSKLSGGKAGGKVKSERVGAESGGAGKKKVGNQANSKSSALASKDRGRRGGDQVQGGDEEEEGQEEGEGESGRESLFSILRGAVRWLLWVVKWVVVVPIHFVLLMVMRIMAKTLLALRWSVNQMLRPVLVMLAPLGYLLAGLIYLFVSTPSRWVGYLVKELYPVYLFLGAAGFIGAGMGFGASLILYMASFVLIDRRGDDGRTHFGSEAILTTSARGEPRTKGMMRSGSGKKGRRERGGGGGEGEEASNYTSELSSSTSRSSSLGSFDPSEEHSPPSSVKRESDEETPKGPTRGKKRSVGGGIDSSVLSGKRREEKVVMPRKEEGGWQAGSGSFRGRVQPSEVRRGNESSGGSDSDGEMLVTGPLRRTSIRKKDYLERDEVDSGGILGHLKVMTPVGRGGGSRMNSTPPPPPNPGTTYHGISSSGSSASKPITASATDPRFNYPVGATGRRGWGNSSGRRGGGTPPSGSMPSSPAYYMTSGGSL
ncbi:hypothetical protein IE53DRAFT_370567 [Violaceomyces palustris]|uniref:Uncharacterized protein n=1 Tax=Violaceomyces palustris TaxID=1673888 RepID=A0ACD0NRY4_9BASI|nr:hypothetical protein IE53DRAFT_370567 [Violaceomyces palustris]